jgi:hypothetical protein
MELPQILYKLLPVFWWIAVWEVTETAINWLVSHKKEWRLAFYIGMILIIVGILYWDDYALHHF